MNEEELRLKKEEISIFAKELKTHYYFNEFFVDPDQKFVGLLEKIIVKYKNKNILTEIF
jgi:hypothetical protein